MEKSKKKVICDLFSGITWSASQYNAEQFSEDSSQFIDTSNEYFQGILFSYWTIY